MKIENKFMKMFSKDCCVPKLFFLQNNNIMHLYLFFCQAAIDQEEKLSKLPLKKENEKR